MLACEITWLEVFSVAVSVTVPAVLSVSVLKVATPAVTPTVVVPPKVPAPLVRLTLTVVEELLEIVLPDASSKRTVNAVMGFEALAVYVRAGLVPHTIEAMVASGLITMPACDTVCKAVFSVAVMAMVPAVVAVTALKVAIPAEAVTVVTPVRLPLPLVRATLTVVALLLVIKLPKGSSKRAVKVVMAVEPLAE